METQSYSNHVRVHPLYHYFALPVQTLKPNWKLPSARWQEEIAPPLRWFWWILPTSGKSKRSTIR